MDLKPEEISKIIKAQIKQYAQKIEQAARAGDTETLRQILTQVLSTDTGQRLAGKVKDAMQDG